MSPPFSAGFAGFPGPRLPSLENAVEAIFFNFVPEMTFGGSAAGVTYSNRSGRGIQLDKFVWFTFQIALLTKGAAGLAAVTLPGMPGAEESTDPQSFIPSIWVSNFPAGINLVECIVFTDPVTVQFHK